MAGTPEQDLLEWLEREEESLGFTTVEGALAKEITEAQAVFYEELGYDMTEAQFEALKGASLLRYEELPTIGVSYERIEHRWGFQSTYRDIVTGRFTAREDVFTLLAKIR